MLSGGGRGRSAVAAARWAAALALLAGLLLLAGCTADNIGGVGSGWNALTVHDGVVYVGTKEGWVQALADGDSNVPPSLWRFPGPGASGDIKGVYSTPLVAEGLLFVAAENGFLYALDPENGDFDNRGWRRPRGQPQSLEPLVAGPAYDPVNRMVLSPSEDGRLYGYAVDSGEEIWDAPFEVAGRGRGPEDLVQPGGGDFGRAGDGVVRVARSSHLCGQCRHRAGNVEIPHRRRGGGAAFAV